MQCLDASRKSADAVNLEVQTRKSDTKTKLHILQLEAVREIAGESESQPRDSCGVQYPTVDSKHT